MTLQPRDPSIACVPLLATGSGAFAAITATNAQGYRVFGWIGREGAAAGREFSTETTPDMYVPLMGGVLAPELVACNPDHLREGKCLASAKVSAFFPDGPSSSISLGDAAPAWEVGAVATALVLDTAGLTVAVQEWGTDHQAPPRWRIRVRTFDDHGRECGAPWVAKEHEGAAAPLYHVAVDDRLNVLVVYEWLLPLKQSAQWFTIDGKPLTPEFPVDVPHPQCEPGCLYTGGQRFLVPLLGGGVVFQLGLQYLAVFPSAEPRYEVAPPWLVELNGMRMYRVGSGGYAFVRLPKPASTTCVNEIELHSVSGAPCGRIALAGIFACPGWPGPGMSVGGDGTVFQFDSGDDRMCRVAVWDALLK